LVNEQLIAEGHARVRDGSPNVKYAERFAQAEQAAQDGRLDLWSTCLQVPDDGEDGAVIDSDMGPSASGIWEGPNIAHTAPSSPGWTTFEVALPGRGPHIAHSPHNPDGEV
jgi:hypothetical protein